MTKTKLSDAQRRMLRAVRETGDLHAHLRGGAPFGFSGATATQHSLMRKGLIQRSKDRERWELTEAGRACLRETFLLVFELEVDPGLDEYAIQEAIEGEGRGRGTPLDATVDECAYSDEGTAEHDLTVRLASRLPGASGVVTLLRVDRLPGVDP